MKDALIDLPGYALNRASTAMVGVLSERLAQLDLRRAEATLLVQIKANPGITPSAAGKLLAIKRANMVPLVSGLEKSGYLLRIPLDGRSFGLSLTEFGTEMADTVSAVFKAHEDWLMQQIPEPHREHFLPALRALWQG